MNSWYIDRSKNFMYETLSNCLALFYEESKGKDNLDVNILIKKIKEHSELGIPEGNINAALTRFRDHGLLNFKNIVGDSAIDFLEGRLNDAELIIDLFLKRPAEKHDSVNIKPFVLLCKVFDIMIDIIQDQDDIFITSYECKEYLCPINDLSEITYEFVEKIINERDYSFGNILPNPRVSLDNNEDTNFSIWFNALNNTPIFIKNDNSRMVLKPNIKQKEFFKYISINSDEISETPTDSKQSLYGYYCSRNTGINEILPDILNDNIESINENDISFIFEYLFGYKRKFDIDYSKYFKNECFGIFFPFITMPGLAIRKLYYKNVEFGDLLYKYISSGVKYEEYLQKFEENLFEFKEYNVSLKEKFRKWLQQNEYAQNTIRNYLLELNIISNDAIKDKLIDKTIYEIQTLKELDDLISNLEENVNFNKRKSVSHNANTAGIKQYRNFLVDLENNRKDGEKEMCDLRKFYIDNLKNNKFIEEQIQKRNEFVEEYSLERLLSLTKEEYCLGLDSQDSFSYKLEFGKYKDTAFGIGGGAACKHGMYYSKEEHKYKGKNNEDVTDPDIYFEQFKNELVSFLKYMENNSPDFNLNEKYPLLGGSGNYMVLTKILCLYYPDKFIGMSKQDIYDRLGDYFDIKYKNNTLLNSFNANIDFRKNIPEAKENDGFYISNAIWKYFYEYLDKKEDNEERVIGAFNKIYYGVPGCGKSYTVNKEFSKDEYHIERTTFHPEYTNSDFVGQIIPKLKDEKVSYEFHAGAFAKALLYALDNPSQKVCLIIEEINRGNASAIFGDIFQLLDRNGKGESSYSIFNGPLIDYLNENGQCITEITIPSNMWIVATMNTSDQNVFTLDTAFKRRWKMEYIKNVFADDVESKELKNTLLPTEGNYTMITWEKFVGKINEHIIKDKSGINGEDKQLGMYFVTIEEIKDPKEFAEKVLSYLWDDVAKLNPQYWFGDISSYDELLKKYDEDYLNVFDRIFEDDIRVMEEKINNLDETTTEGE